MATEKLLRALVSGPEEKLDEAIHRLILDREFHPLSAATLGGHHHSLTKQEGEDPYRPALDAATALLGRLGLKAGFREFRGRGYGLEDCTAYITATSGAAARIITHRNAAMSLADDDEELISRFEPFSLLDVRLEELLEVKNIRLRFGKVQEELWDELRHVAESEFGAFIFRTGFSGDKVCCILLTLAGGVLREEERLVEYGFEPEERPNAAGLTGVPAERMAGLRAEAEAARAQAGALSEELAALAAREEDEALSRWCWLKYMSEGFSLRSLAGHDSGEFYLTGWLPEADGPGFKQAAEALGCVCSFERPGRGEAGHVPVKLKEGFWYRVFAPFVTMYGYPAYGECDPRIFMLVTYCLLFGVMFGDVGQGALLVLIGLYMAKKKGMWLGRILAAVGCAAVVFGFVYGSVFGNEHLLPGFKVLEGSGVMQILLVSAGGGVVLILISGVLNIMTAFRQRDYRAALFSANGVTGVLFLAGAVSCAVSDAAFGTGLLSQKPLLFAFGLLLLSIWLGEPLTMALGLAPKEHGHKSSVGMLLLEGFFELFEAFLSWFSNCLSFLRVGTYAICHAIMMLIVYELSATSGGGYSIFGLVLGNALVMLIESVLVCIQALRLEFYELFGRFYTGRGSPFEPVRVDYTAQLRGAA